MDQHKKYILSGLLLFFSLATTAQTPYLSVRLKMDSVKIFDHRYKIEMKFCDPVKTTERGDWFSPDTSKIDFASLKPGDINCKEYFESEKTYGEEKPVFNQFKHGSHNFAWEKILVFKIHDLSSRGWQAEMYVVVPMKYKS